MVALPRLTAHSYWETLAASIHILLLNKIDETIATLGWDSPKVALLATRATIESGILQSKLMKKGIEVIADSKCQLQHERELARQLRRDHRVHEPSTSAKRSR
jgi:aspartate/glutamate racemase